MVVYNVYLACLYVIVSHYDLSVRPMSMSVICLKKLGWGGGDMSGLRLNQLFFICFLCKAPTYDIHFGKHNMLIYTFFSGVLTNFSGC